MGWRIGWIADGKTLPQFRNGGFVNRPNASDFLSDTLDGHRPGIAKYLRKNSELHVILADRVSSKLPAGCVQIRPYNPYKTDTL